MGKVVKIVWTIDGITSLEEIASYIAKDSPFYAGNFAHRIINLIDNLKNFPEIGRIVPEYDDPMIRELIYQNYRIVYKIENQTVYILLVIYSAKRLPANM